MADETLDQTQQTQQTQEEPRFKVKVDGVEKEVPLSELQAAYSKVAAADQRFREAAELRKEAEAKIKVADALQDFLTNPTPEKLKQLALLSGHPAEEAEKAARQAEEIMKAAQQGQQGQQGQQVGLAGSGEGDDAFYVGEEDLDPRVRAKLKELEEIKKKLEQQENEKFWQQIYAEIENDIDNHPILSKISEEARSELKRVAKQSAVVEVWGRQRDWSDVRPNLLEGVVEFARKLRLDVGSQAPNSPSPEGGTQQAATAVGPGATLPPTTASETSKPQEEGEKPMFGTPGYFERMVNFARQILRKPPQQ